MRAWLFFIPYFISLYFKGNPDTQYWICWVGSFWIFLVTFMGWVNPLPKDLTFAQQFMRPFIFAHFLFAGYMVLSSVFFFIHYHGYYYFEIVDVPDPIKIAKIAKCQQYYQLAHASLAMGLTIWMDGFEHNRKHAIPVTLNTHVFLKLTLLSFILLQLFNLLPFASALRGNLNALSLLASLLFFVHANHEKKQFSLALGLLVFNIAVGTLSGMKSATLTIILFLGAQYFARYRIQTIILGAFSIWLWFSFIPTISSFVRQQSWYGGQSSTQALQNALIGIRNKTIDTRKLNWELLVLRSSEIGMFIRYVDHIPAKRNFYGLKIFDQAIMGLLPSFMRPDGKSIDETAMERAIDAGIIDRRIDKSTSAKPALVADAYMSGGEIAIFLTFFLFGSMATQLAKICERLFGGYTLGSILIFNGCFSIFQSGNCFENIPASIFYGIIMMYFMYFLMLELKILQRVQEQYLTPTNHI